jgi:hypothetical protein
MATAIRTADGVFSDATGTACQMFTFKASDGGFDWFCLPIFGTWVAG